MSSCLKTRGIYIHRCGVNSIRSQKKIRGSIKKKLLLKSQKRLRVKRNYPLHMNFLFKLEQILSNAFFVFVYYNCTISAYRRLKRKILYINKDHPLRLHIFLSFSFNLMYVITYTCMRDIITKLVLLKHGFSFVFAKIKLRIRYKFTQ